MVEEKIKINFAILGIVAIVAIVSIVLLLGQGRDKVYSDEDIQNIMTDSIQENLGGNFILQDYGRYTPTCGFQDYGSYECWYCMGSSYIKCRETGGPIFYVHT